MSQRSPPVSYLDGSATFTDGPMFSGWNGTTPTQSSLTATVRPA